MESLAVLNEARSQLTEFLPLEPIRSPSAMAAMPLGASVPGAELGLGALLRFKSMMAADGQPVHLARLCADRHYAYERIASAHASANADLRRVALELFQIYHASVTGGAAAQ